MSGESWRVERRDSVERLVSGYIIIGRCGFGVVEVLMWYGRDPASPEAAPRQAGVGGVEEVNGVEWRR